METLACPNVNVGGQEIRMSAISIVFGDKTADENQMMTRSCGCLSTAGSHPQSNESNEWRERLVSIRFSDAVGIIERSVGDERSEHRSLCATHMSER